MKNINTQVDKETAITGQEAEITLPDGQVLDREQMKKFSEAFGVKKEEYNRKKQELSDMQYEASILHRTEDLVKGRHDNIEEFLKRREEHAGVEGYHAIQNESHDVQETTTKINDVKGETLREISEMVKEMAKTLNDSKEKLQPLVCVFAG